MISTMCVLAENNLREWVDECSLSVYVDAIREAETNNSVDVDSLAAAIGHAVVNDIIVSAMKFAIDNSELISGREPEASDSAGVEGDK